MDLFEKVDDYLFFNQNIGGSTYNYRTYYNGENWEVWEILPYDESIIYEFVHYDNIIYALLNQGISVSSDYGTSWELIDIPSITGYIHLQYVDDQYLYVNHGCILYRYNIATFEWTDITGILDNIGPPEPYSCTSIHQIEKFNDKLLISIYWYGGVGTLFYSQNNGDSWEIINSFPSLSSSGNGINNIPALATKNGIFYAGTATSDDGIYYTQNLSDWTEYSAGLINYNLSVSALEVTEENIYKLGGSVNLFQNELIGVDDNVHIVPSEYATIQEAINAASEGDSVLVSTGTYYENIIWAETNGIKLIGSGVDDCIIDGGSLVSVIRFEENLDGIIDSTTLITGFTIQNGNSQVFNPYHRGGGMFLWYASPTLTDMIFSYNMATWGGGMWLYHSNPTLTDVTFSDNTANNSGGGMWIDYSNPALRDVTFSDNTATNWGGGMGGDESSPTLTGVIFSENLANYFGGGGMALDETNPILNDVTFSDNSAGSKGGAIYLSASSISGSYVLINNNYSEGHGAGIFISVGSNINLNNSTIASNIIGEGDTFGAGIYADGGTATLINSIVYYNRREGDYGINYNLNGYTMDILDEYTVSYSDIEGDDNWIPEGAGNISISPEVNDFENGDFTLQSSSPCIDTGNPESPLDPDGTRTDMGIYYYHQETNIFGCTDPEASNYDADATVDDGSCEYYCTLGDVNCDGYLNVLDIIIVSDCALADGQGFGCYDELGDLNEDGTVNILDIVTLINWVLNGLPPEPVINLDENIYQTMEKKP